MYKIIHFYTNTIIVFLDITKFVAYKFHKSKRARPDWAQRTRVSIGALGRNNDIAGPGARDSATGRRARSPNASGAPACPRV